MIGAYGAVVSARYRMLLQYRAAAIAGFATQLFWGGIRIMVLAAFYAAATRDAPMSFEAVVTYVWLGQALIGILPWSVDTDISEMISTGGVSYEMTRPIDLYWFWFARTIALRTASTTLRSFPIVILTMLVFPLIGLGDYALSAPASAVAFGLFIVALFWAVMLACAITMVMHVMLVWTVSGEGFNRVLPSLTSIFAGMIIPLPLYPDFMQPFLNYQPFRGLVDVPFRIYSGDIAAAAATGDILQQVVWTLLLVWIGRLILARSIRDLVVHGG